MAHLGRDLVELVEVAQQRPVLLPGPRRGQGLRRPGRVVAEEVAARLPSSWWSNYGQIMVKLWSNQGQGCRGGGGGGPPAARPSLVK